MIRVATAVLLAAALAGCGSAPKKAPPPPPAERVPPQAQADGPKRSPYAPAVEDPTKRGDYVAGGLYAPHVQDSAPDAIPPPGSRVSIASTPNGSTSCRAPTPSIRAIEARN